MFPSGFRISPISRSGLLPVRFSQLAQHRSTLGIQTGSDHALFGFGPCFCSFRYRTMLFCGPDMLSVKDRSKKGPFYRTTGLGPTDTRRTMPSTMMRIALNEQLQTPCKMLVDARLHLQLVDATLHPYQPQGLHRTTTADLCASGRSADREEVGDVVRGRLNSFTTPKRWVAMDSIPSDMQDVRESHRRKSPKGAKNLLGTITELRRMQITELLRVQS